MILIIDDPITRRNKPMKKDVERYYCYVIHGRIRAALDVIINKGVCHYTRDRAYKSLKSISALLKESETRALFTAIEHIDREGHSELADLIHKLRVKYA